MIMLILNNSRCIVMNMNNNVLSVNEFAKRIKSSRLTVVKMIKEGKILAFRISDSPKSHYRIRESEIDRLISFELHKRMDKDKKEKNDG